MNKRPPAGLPSPVVGGKRTTADLLREVGTLTARLGETEEALRVLRRGRRQGMPDSPESTLEDWTRELAAMNRELLEEIRERFSVEEDLSRSEARFRSIYENAPMGIVLLNRRGRILEANPAMASMLGVPAAKLPGRPLLEFLSRGQDPLRRRVYDELILRKTTVVDVGIRWTGPEGKEAFGHARLSLYDPHSDGSPLFLCMVVELTNQKNLETALIRNVRRQSAIAELGRLTLGGSDSSTVLPESVSRVARLLRVPLCAYMEIAPDRSGFLLRAGAGFGEGIVGEYRSSTGLDSQSGYTLLTGSPVTVPDLRAETRFRVSVMPLKHGARSGASVPVAGEGGEPFGVLVVYDVKRRLFDPGEVAFLVSAAQILGLFLERQKIGEELADAKELLEKVFSNIHILVAYLDTEFRFIRVNQAYADATGHDPSFFVGKNHFRLFPDAGNEEIFRTVLSTGKPFFVQGKPFEYPEFPERGTTYWDWSLVPVLESDGTVSGLLLCLLDVTERKEAEEELRRSEERIRTLVDALPLGVFILRGGKVVFCNREREAGKDSGSGKDEFRKVLAVVPEDAERFEKFCDGLVHKEGCIQGGEFRLETERRKTRPAERWFRLEASPIRFEREKATLVLAIDITPQKEIEHRLLQREKLASLGLMSAGIAHEIRNPLSGVTLYVAALEHYLDHAKIDPDAGETLRTISRKVSEAAERIASVIQRILEFARPAHPVFVPTDVNRMVREATRLLSSTVRLEHVRLRKILAGDLPACHADPTLIRQMLMNLLTNSLQAMKEGEGTKQLEVATAAGNGEVLITISDSGKGVPAHLKEKIFDPFFSTKKGGFGIGLSFTRRVLDDHGGRIRVAESRWGGARFEISLPVGKGGDDP